MTQLRVVIDSCQKLSMILGLEASSSLPTGMPSLSVIPAPTLIFPLMRQRSVRIGCGFPLRPQPSATQDKVPTGPRWRSRLGPQTRALGMHRLRARVAKSSSVVLRPRTQTRWKWMRRQHRHHLLGQRTWYGDPRTATTVGWRLLAAMQRCKTPLHGTAHLRVMVNAARWLSTPPTCTGMYHGHGPSYVETFDGMLAQEDYRCSSDTYRRR